MRTSSYITAIAALGVALTVASGAALAHGKRGACRQDLQALCPNVTPGPGSFRSCIQTLCPDITPGPGAFGACLKQHASQLSPACQEHLNRMQANITAWQQACGADVQTYCADAAGPRAVFQCIHEHRDQLSQTCQDFLAKHHRHHRHHHHHMPTPAPDSGSSAE